jgi:hypothetical protein
MRLSGTSDRGRWLGLLILAIVVIAIVAAYIYLTSAR